jgi:hypothetical protein
MIYTSSILFLILCADELIDPFLLKVGRGFPFRSVVLVTKQTFFFISSWFVISVFKNEQILFFVNCDYSTLHSENQDGYPFLPS